MANRPLVGSGPIPFTASDKFYFVPATDLSITAKGVVDSSKWRGSKIPDGTADQIALDKLVTGLLARESLKIAPAAAPDPALVFRAARQGAAGNGITVTVTKVEPDAATPADSKLDLTVVETVEFKGLSVVQTDAKFVGTLLGAAASPPVVKLKVPLAATIEYPFAKTYSVTAPADLTVVQKADNTQTSFVLVDADGVSGPTISVVVTEESATVFNLTVTRTTTKAGAKVSTVITRPSGDSDALKHAIVVDKPDGKPAALPKKDTYTLSGGSSEVTVPAAKSAIVTFTDA